MVIENIEHLKSIELVGLGESALASIAGNTKKRARFNSLIEATKPGTWSKKERLAVLRGLAARTTNHIDTIFGLTLGRIVSEASVSFERGIREVQAKFDSKFEVFDPKTGKAKPLSETKAQAAKARRAQAYAISKGMEQLAKENGWSMVVATITSPGEYSPASASYDGKSLAESCKVLKHRWSLMRKAFADAKIVTFGYCRTEPQMSGAGHMHIPVFTDNPEAVQRIFAAHRVLTCSCNQSQMAKDLVNGRCKCGEVPPEQERQIHTKIWDPDMEGGSSIATYLSKTVFTDEEDSIVMAAWRRATPTRTMAWFGVGRGFQARWTALYRSDRSDTTIDPQTRYKASRAKHKRDWGSMLRLAANIPSVIRQKATAIVRKRAKPLSNRKRDRNSWIAFLKSVANGTWRPPQTPWQAMMTKADHKENENMKTLMTGMLGKLTSIADANAPEVPSDTNINKNHKKTMHTGNRDNMGTAKPFQHTPPGNQITDILTFLEESKETMLEICGVQVNSATWADGKKGRETGGLEGAASVGVRVPSNLQA